MRKIAMLAICVCMSTSIFASTVDFKITIKDGLSSTISIGQHRTLEIWANAPTAAENYGIHLWNLDLKAEGTGTVQISNPVSIFEPNPHDSFEGWTVNDPQDGSITWLGSQPPLGQDPVSNAGVNGYTKMAEVTIEAIAAGTVNYSMGDFFFAIPQNSFFYATLRDGTTLDGVFDSENSVTELIITPEPATIALFGIMSLFAFKRKK